VSFKSKSWCTVIRNTLVCTFLLRLQHSTADWAHKCKSIEQGQTGDFWLRNREKTSCSFKYNQQDATLYNILYYCQCFTLFRLFLCPSSGAQKLYTTSGICQACLLLPLTHASVSSKQVWHIPDAVYTVLRSWWWAEEPPETCKALTVIKNVVWRWILLVMLKEIH
jgi:hypothetical protein